MPDELMAAFVDDSREHLEGIESDILALKTMGGNFDEELVNRVFRAAHFIKGTACFLGLGTIGSLARKLENALQLMRDGQLICNGLVRQVLLQGFDMLNAMVNAPDESENQDITPFIEDIQGLLSPESQISAETSLTFSATDGHQIFDVDLLTLNQALKGGRYLYHIEFDLIHDIQRKNITPQDAIKSLQNSGLVLDCKVATEAVGNLELGIANMIPLNVLYASIIDPEIIGVLLNIADEKIRELNRAMFQEQAKTDAAGSRPRATLSPARPAELRTPVSLCMGQGVVMVSVAQKANSSQAFEFRKILLEALRQSPHVRLDMEQTTEVDASFVQLVAATYQSCIGKNGSFRFLAPPRDSVAKTLRELGLAWLLRSAA